MAGGGFLPLALHLADQPSGQTLRADGANVTVGLRPAADYIDGPPHH
jgi:hypothetical protein